MCGLQGQFRWMLWLRSWCCYRGLGVWAGWAGSQCIILFTVVRVLHLLSLSVQAEGPGGRLCQREWVRRRSTPPSYL